MSNPFRKAAPAPVDPNRDARIKAARQAAMSMDRWNRPATTTTTGDVR